MSLRSQKKKRGGALRVRDLNWGGLQAQRKENQGPNLVQKKRQIKGKGKFKNEWEKKGNAGEKTAPRPRGEGFWLVKSRTLVREI